MGAPCSHSGSALRRDSSPLGRRDRWIDDSVRLFLLLCGCPFAKVHAKGEDLMDESKEGDQRVHRPDGCGSVGGTFFPLSVPSIKSASGSQRETRSASRPCGVPPSKYQAFTRIGLRRTGTWTPRPTAAGTQKRTPNITPDCTVIQWVAVAQAFSTEGLQYAMGEGDRQGG